MTNRRLRTAVLGVLAAIFATAAEAHPHVWVTVKTELVFGADGAVEALRHAWTFDEMFSAFATQGLDKNNDGKLTREELAELAETNVTSLEEFGFFSVGKSGGKDLAFGKPKDYWLEADKDNILTLHFTLPVTTKPAKAGLTLNVFDPTWFVDFSFAEKEAVTTANAPAGCTVDIKRPEPPAVATTGLSESFFNSLTAASEFGSQFASRLTLRCK